MRPGAPRCLRGASGVQSCEASGWRVQREIVVCQCRAFRGVTWRCFRELSTCEVSVVDRRRTLVLVRASLCASLRHGAVLHGIDI